MPCSECWSWCASSTLQPTYQEAGDQLLAPGYTEGCGLRVNYVDRSEPCWSSPDKLHTQCNCKVWVQGNIVKCWCLNCKQTFLLGPLADDLRRETDDVVNLTICTWTSATTRTCCGSSSSAPQ